MKRGIGLSAALALLCLLPLGWQLSCGSSSLRVRVVFPDAASRDQSATLTLLAVESDPELSCPALLGRSRAELGARVLSGVELDLAHPTGSPSLPDVPMHKIFITALVLDKEAKLFLQACAVVDAHPGDDLEVVLRLNCAPGRKPCLDLDGDGEPADTDCDDTDPCRTHLLAEAPNLCGKPADSFPPLSAACLDELRQQGKTLAPPYCDDGIDEDCDGQDAHCVVDEDCDGFSPPLDCDDHDPAVHPGASEVCDGKDNNCNGVVDEGCSPCDVDGDGHALASTTVPGCNLPKDDPDDYDAGIFPGSTAKTGGAEGGNVLGALRGWCRTAPVEKDGRAPRNVDHDGDKLPASQDGCPPLSCDLDGDGFPGSQCNPPSTLLDCDDGDPHTFPGAPDKCGDGKAQNCIADASCACDKDGDGYCPPADCDDGDPGVHPWAVEVCNGKDDDCDELIDEGNPDPSGNPMGVSSKSCNDSNVGWCGDCTGHPQDCKNGHLLSGICACSPITPTGKRDPGGNRVACPGENLGAKASPRCFNARQPQAEICNGVDDDCNGTVDDAATVCAGGGTCCGSLSAPGCKDLGSDFNNCGSCGNACNPNTATTCKQKQCRCGINAACSNGFSCSGGSCACGGCLSGSTCLAGTGLTACGKYGAACVNCASNGRTCVAQTCVCGGCMNGTTCVPGGSSNACGKGGGTCTDCTATGRTCSSQACVCAGCVSGVTCYPGTDTAHCGSSGGNCAACSAPVCQNPTCTGGACGTTPASNGTTCAGGVCIGGACCTGCVSGGSTCVTVPSDTACGTGGAACVNCTTTAQTCSGGTCI